MDCAHQLDINSQTERTKATQRALCLVTDIPAPESIVLLCHKMADGQPNGWTIPATGSLDWRPYFLFYKVIHSFTSKGYNSVVFSISASIPF